MNIWQVKCVIIVRIYINLGSKKIYNCKKCKIEIDRDINASINIYKKGLL